MNERELEARSPERAGQMTQLMRAAARSAAPKKVLRIALVHRGVVVDEQVAAAGASVTVGPTERATFVVASSALAPSHPLFEHEGGTYRLNLLAGMTGRVATRAGLVDLGGPNRKLSLGVDARGKVVVGDATFLFQFVDEKRRAAKAPLPLSAQASLTSEIDWTTTIVAAVSFLLHFGIVASLYGDWLDPTVDDSVVVGQLVDVVRALPPMPGVERHEDKTERPVATGTLEARASSTGGAKGDRAPGTRKAEGSGKMSDAAATKLSTTLDALNVAMMGVLNGKGPSTDAVLQKGGDLPTGLFDDIATRNVGVGGSAIAGLDTGHGDLRVVTPGSGGHGGLPGIGVTVGTAPTSAGSSVAVARPKGGIAQITPPQPTGGEVPGAGGTVAAMAPGFRHCYNDGLAHEDPTMHGSMRVIARIGPNGDVLSANAAPGGGNLSGTVMGCVASRVATAHFEAPIGGGATLAIPVTFLLP